MNNQPIKRRDPFAKPLKQEVQKPEVEEEIVEEVVENEDEQEAEVEDEVIMQPVVKPVTPKLVQKQAPKQQRQSSKNYYMPEENVDRQKYTATMDVALRRKIKIVCATRGIMFSEFIEMACKEKLSREGER